MCIFVPATYGNFLSNIAVTYFGDRFEVLEINSLVNVSRSKMIETDESNVIVVGFWEMNSFRHITIFFCQQAENDRKEVAAAITPLCGYPG